ncbi:hypothetical protein FB45DRAFT_1019281 [Roridomyces roridus]|uniref:Uncharacterized protein n=1 Tax=Roridomyces roridus TaxID=1738132 RepID=A0AAD7CEJ6_9AGAR|nr:hypothetical protein FB45DRAFT_1019281 [Roridomyces roridus]
MSTSTESVSSAARASPPSRRPRPRSPASMYIAYETIAAKPPKPLLKLYHKLPKGKGKAADPPPEPKPRTPLGLRLSLRRKQPASDTTSSQYSVLSAVDQAQGHSVNKARHLLGTVLPSPLNPHTRADDSSGTSDLSSSWRTSTFSSGYGRRGGGPSTSDFSLAATSFEEKERLADDLYLRHDQGDDGAAIVLEPIEFAPSSRLGRHPSASSLGATSFGGGEGLAEDQENHHNALRLDSPIEFARPPSSGGYHVSLSRGGIKMMASALATTGYYSSSRPPDDARDPATRLDISAGAGVGAESPQVVVPSGRSRILVISTLVIFTLVISTLFKPLTTGKI